MTTTATSANSATRNTSIFASREQHMAFVAAFKALAARRALTPEVLALRALALGKPLGRTFSPVVNAVKLANGHDRWHGALQALGAVPYSSYRPELAELVKHLPDGAYKTLSDAAVRVRAPQLEAEYADRAARAAK